MNCWKCQGEMSLTKEKTIPENECNNLRPGVYRIWTCNSCNCILHERVEDRTPKKEVANV